MTSRGLPRVQRSARPVDSRCSVHRIARRTQVRSHELTTGRTFGVNFDHGDDFFSALRAFCSANRVRHGYIPMFIAGFAEAEVVGACEKIENPDAPLWS